MLMPPLPRALILTAALLAGMAPRARADVYIPTTSTVLLQPTAYYVPTSYYYFPTSYAYVTPTVYTGSYVSTSYYVPTTYYAVSYVRPRLFRRPLVTTVYTVPTATYAYAPTSYYVATAYDLPVLRTTSAVVYSDTASVLCEPAAEAVERVESAPVRDGGGAAGQSEPTLDRPQRGPVSSTPLQSGSSGGPPAAPVDTDRELVPVPEPGGSPPIPDPPGTVQSGTAAEGRIAFRPVGHARSTLSGRVVSAVQGTPEKGVVVTLYPASDRFRPRTTTTDDQGRFQVTLTEGDWTVRVPKPGATAFLDQPITVSGGLITDGKDQVVSVLTIHR